MDAMLQAARAAYGQIPLYKMLYRECPQAPDEVPFITSTHYFRAEGTLDCIASEEISCVLPPFRREFRRLVHTVVESDGDVDARLDRIRLALDDVGALSSSVRRMLIVSDDSNGPFACDLSTCLGWEGFPASIHYWNGDPDELRFQLNAVAPDWLIWCRAPEAHAGCGFPMEKTILAHCIDDPLPDWSGALWLFCDEVNLIGSRPAGRTAFRVDQKQFFVESGPSGRPALTTLTRELFPLVRYELLNAFEVL